MFFLLLKYSFKIQKVVLFSTFRIIWFCIRHLKLVVKLGVFSLLCRQLLRVACGHASSRHLSRLVSPRIQPKFAAFCSAPQGIALKERVPQYLGNANYFFSATSYRGVLYQGFHKGFIVNSDLYVANKRALLLSKRQIYKKSRAWNTNGNPKFSRIHQYIHGRFTHSQKLKRHRNHQNNPCFHSGLVSAAVHLVFTFCFAKLGNYLIDHVFSVQGDVDSDSHVGDNVSTETETVDSEATNTVSSCVGVGHQESLHEKTTEPDTRPIVTNGAKQSKHRAGDARVHLARRKQVTRIVTPNSNRQKQIQDASVKEDGSVLGKPLAHPEKFSDVQLEYQGHGLFQCPCCLDSVPYQDVLFLSKDCEHEICRWCATAWVRQEALEGASLGAIQCPACKVDTTGNSPVVVGRVDDATLRTILFSSAPSPFLRSAMRIALRNQDAHLVACTNSSCLDGYGCVIPGSPRTVCFKCNLSWCTECNCPWHTGLSCEAHRRELDESSKTQPLRDLAKKLGWKECPRCSQCVERLDGCNRMKCTCGQYFCYLCGSKLKKGDPYSHFSADLDSKTGCAFVTLVTNQT